MGSSKKHKEKKEKKKHKKRSRSRERDRESHKKSHKSSSRKERKRSITPDFESGDEKRRRIGHEDASCRDAEMHIEEKSPVRVREPSPDDLFDIDKLLDSKLCEKNESVVDRALKKRSRESALEEFRRRQNICNKDKDPIEKITSERVVENYSHTEVKPPISPVPESSQKEKAVEIPFLTDEPAILPEIKQEPPDNYPEEYVEGCI